MQTYYSFLMAIASISIASPSFGQDMSVQEILRQGELAMAAPIQFRVGLTRHDFKHGALFAVDDKVKSILPKDERLSNERRKATRTKEIEYMVYLSGSSTPRIRIELGGDSMQLVVLLSDSRSFDYFPKQNTAIDSTFKLSEVKGSWQEMTSVFDVQGELVCTEELADKWTCRATNEKFVTELVILKKSRFVESKKVFDSKTKELLREYRYSDIQSKPVFPANCFELDSAAKLLVAENGQDYNTKFMGILKENLDKDVAHLSSLKEKKSTKIDPSTGNQILHAPSTMTNEEFARSIGEAIEKLPSAKGLSDEQKKELAAKWKTNSGLKPVGLDASGKVNRQFGRVWVYLGLGFALCTIVMVSIRYFRKH